MKRIFPWLAVPLGMMAFCFFVEVVTAGLRIERNGDDITIWMTNAPNFLAVEYSDNLASTNWIQYSRHDCDECVRLGMDSLPLYQFSIKPNTNSARAFWRIRDCSAP